MVIKVRSRQNIFDIAIQYFGDVEFVSRIITDNNLTWSAPLEVGEELQINNTGVGNSEIRNFFELGGFVVQNGAITVLPGEEGTTTFDSTLSTWDRTDITFDTNDNI